MQGASKEQAHWLQRAGTRELARWLVLAQPDLSPHSIQESHPPLPLSARKPLESRRVKLLARNQAADDPGQLGVLSFRVLSGLSHVSFLLFPLTEEILSSSPPRSRMFEEEGGCYHLPGAGWGP